MATNAIAQSEAQPPEEWRDIPEWEGYYQASSLGRIRRVTYSPPRLMSPSFDKDGYRVVTLSRNNKWRPWRVAMLVCAAFHGPRPDGLQAAHDDGSKDNDVPENLFWKTPLAQAADKHRHGTTIRGHEQHLSRLSEAQVLDIRSRYVRGNGAQLAREFGVTTAAISAVVNRRVWKHV